MIALLVMTSPLLSKSAFLTLLQLIWEQNYPLALKYRVSISPVSPSTQWEELSVRYIHQCQQLLSQQSLLLAMIVSLLGQQSRFNLLILKLFHQE